MQPQLVSEYKSTQAKNYADLVTIKKDLNQVIIALNELVGLQKSERRSKERETIYFEFAVVKYFRCFSGGCRLNLNSIEQEYFSQLFHRDSETQGIVSAKEVHEYFKGLRDKYIAHSVNSFENSKVLVLLENPSIKKQIMDAGLLTLGHYFTACEGKLLEIFGGLVNWTRDKVKEMIDKAYEELIEEVKLSPIEELYSRSYYEIKVNKPEVEDVKKSRLE